MLGSVVALYFCYYPIFHMGAFLKRLLKSNIYTQLPSSMQIKTASFNSNIKTFKYVCRKLVDVDSISLSSLDLRSSSAKALSIPAYRNKSWRFCNLKLDELIPSHLVKPLLLLDGWKHENHILTINLSYDSSILPYNGNL